MTNHLRATREAAGLSQAELSRRSAVDQATISRLEAGTSRPTDSTRVRLAAALNADPFAVFPLPTLAELTPDE